MAGILKVDLTGQIKLKHTVNVAQTGSQLKVESVVFITSIYESVGSKQTTFLESEQWSDLNGRFSLWRR